MVKNKVSCGFSDFWMRTGPTAHLPCRERQARPRQAIHRLIIVVDDLPFGIADFLMADI